LSTAMIRAGRRKQERFPAIVADLRALPLACGAHYVTCLFDSMNFLLALNDVAQTMREMAHALTPGGILYFDIVTERMVLDHFAGQSWTESDGRLRSTWQSDYAPDSGIAKTLVRVGRGPACSLYERVYGREEIEEALDCAGFRLLGVYDADTWRPPGKKTARIDIFAAKPPIDAIGRDFPKVVAELKNFHS